MHVAEVVAVAAEDFGFLDSASIPSDQVTWSVGNGRMLSPVHSIETGRTFGSSDLILTQSLSQRHGRLNKGEKAKKKCWPGVFVVCG